jgi:hypothetical protein
MAGVQGIISSNAMTLADYALASNQPLIQRITMSLIDYGNVLTDVPMVTKATLIQNGTRFEGNLPVPNWTPLNSEGVTVKGTPTAYAEQLYLIRNYIDVDKFIVMDENQISEPRAVQTQAFLEGLTYDFNTKFFKNDHITGDVNSFVGIRGRIDNGSVFGVRPENKIDAGSLDCTQATLATTPANGNKLIEFVEQLLWSVGSPNGAGVVLYMNDNMKRRFSFALRQMGTSGGLAITQDQFGRTIESYKGAQIKDPGVKADQVTRIILGPSQAGITGQFGETATGTDGASTTTPLYTSIYAVNYGTDHFFGWQMAPFNAQDLGLVYDGAFYRTLIDWTVGFMNVSTRSLGRLYDIKIA